MFNHRDITTRAQARKLRFGKSLMSPSGHPYNPARCVEEVNTSGTSRWSHFEQCSKKSGYGPAKLFCRVHDPAAIAARSAERSRKWYEQIEARERPYRERKGAIRLLRRLRHKLSTNGSITENDELVEKISSFLERVKRPA